MAFDKFGFPQGIRTPAMLQDIENATQSVQNLKDQLNTLELDALKMTEMDWDKENSLKSVMEKITEELETLEKVTESLNALTDHAEKHELFSKDLLEKFQELSDLVNDIIPENLQNNINDLESALDDMDLNQMQEALNRNERVELRDVFSLEPRVQKARISRNPKTNDKVNTPEKKSILFKMSKEWAIKINEKK